MKTPAKIVELLTKELDLCHGSMQALSHRIGINRLSLKQYTFDQDVVPTYKNLRRLSEYFKVSIDELTGMPERGSEEGDPREAMVMTLYRQAGEEKKKEVLRLLLDL